MREDPQQRTKMASNKNEPQGSWQWVLSNLCLPNLLKQSSQSLNCKLNFYIFVDIQCLLYYARLLLQDWFININKISLDYRKHTESSDWNRLGDRERGREKGLWMSFPEWTKALYVTLMKISGRTNKSDRISNENLQFTYNLFIFPFFFWTTLGIFICGKFSVQGI